jgi:hypothetical protein
VGDHNRPQCRTDMRPPRVLGDPRKYLTWLVIDSLFGPLPHLFGCRPRFKMDRPVLNVRNDSALGTSVSSDGSQWSGHLDMKKAMSYMSTPRASTRVVVPVWISFS